MDFEKDCKQRRFGNIRKILVDKDKDDFKFAFRIYLIAFVILFFTPIIFYIRYHEAKLNELVEVEYTVVKTFPDSNLIYLKDSRGILSYEKTDFREIVKEGDKTKKLIPRYEAENKQKPDHKNNIITISAISSFLLLVFLIVFIGNCADSVIFDSKNYLRIRDEYIDSDEYLKEIRTIKLIKSLQMPILIVSIGLYLFVLCYGA